MATRGAPAALVVSALILAGPTTACGQSPISKTEINLLGTVCTISLYDGKPADIDAAFGVIRQVELRMSASSEHSEVSAVNRSAGQAFVPVSADTFRVITRALELSSLSDGAFDVSVGPLAALWGIGTATARVPRASEISAVLPLVDYRFVMLRESDRSVFLRKKGMGLDLGAIAKGHAADEAARILKSRGAAATLINLGGNILTVGKKPDGSPWRIGIQDPEKARGESIGYVETGPTSVVTSGVYERYFTADGVRYHHIFDTSTGYPVTNGLAAVSIIADSSIDADGYSTLAFALGLEKGRGLIERASGGVNAVFITETREVYVTPALKPRFRLTNPAFTLKGW